MPKRQFLTSVGLSCDRNTRKESNLEKQGEAVCGESRKHGFEAEGSSVTNCSTVTVVKDSNHSRSCSFFLERP